MSPMRSRLSDAARRSLVKSPVDYVLGTVRTLSIAKPDLKAAVPALLDAMLDVDPQAELAPRDIVARAVFAEIEAGRRVFLDCRTAIGARFPQAFPTVYAHCKAAGIDPVTDLIPVAPASP